MSIFPFDLFRTLLRDSLADARCLRLAAAAAFKDALALLEGRPRSVAGLFPDSPHAAEVFSATIAATVEFIQRDFAPAMASNTPGGTIMSSEGAVVVAVSSPFAGAIPTEALNLCMGDRGQASQLRNVRLGIINPGRSGLTNLSTDEVMWWRLWDIAAAGNDHELELLILPGPRLRFGICLPDGFPYQFVGLLTRSWSSVAICLPLKLQIVYGTFPLLGMTGDYGS